MKQTKLIILPIIMLGLLLVAGVLVFRSACHSSVSNFDGDIASLLQGQNLSAGSIIQSVQAAIQRQLGTGMKAKIGATHIGFLCQGSVCTLERIAAPIYEEPISGFCPRYDNPFLRTVIEFHFDAPNNEFTTNTYSAGVAVPRVDWGYSLVDVDEAKTIALKELASISNQYTSSSFALTLFYSLNEWQVSARLDLTGNTAFTERFTIDYQTDDVNYEN